jgi:hypothetical protein
MSKRVTIIISDTNNTKLHDLQGKSIGKFDGNISFSDVINFAIEHALHNGFNVSEIVNYKETKRR